MSSCSNLFHFSRDDRGVRVEWRALVSFRCALAAFALVLSLVAQASAAEEVIALDYSAPLGCPSAVEFQDQIRGFIPTVSVVPRSASPRVFAISIDEGGTFGRLQLWTGQGGGSRVAHGADCAEVARLLAFAVALVLDPQLQMEEPASSAGNDLSDVPPDPGILPRPLPALLPAQRALAASSDQRLGRSAAQPRARPLRHSLAAVGSIANAMSPADSFGVGALYGVATSLGSLRPEIRFGASYFTSADASRDGATVNFFEVLGAVGVCPTTVPAGVIQLSPCLQVDLGARSTSATGIPNARGDVRRWLSVDALLLARSRLASPLYLELGGGVMIPAWHDRVFLDLHPDVTVHTVPNLGFLGQIAVGIEFGDRNRK